MLIKKDDIDDDKQQDAINENIQHLENVLKDFNITANVKEVHVGPTVAQYELEVASGTRVNKITSINREIALELAKKDVRIEAPIPGKGTVGIEVPNETKEAVYLKDVIGSGGKTINKIINFLIFLYIFQLIDLEEFVLLFVLLIVCVLPHPLWNNLI